MASGGWDGRPPEGGGSGGWAPFARPGNGGLVGGRLLPVGSLGRSCSGLLAAWVFAWGGRSGDCRSWRVTCPCGPSWWLRFEQCPVDRVA
ncbi:hypothetical protein L873DRAFT_818134 [Choiromyces venosus 120613-1]|uniref:Uncharacterized protein n=1 Tax=Choiromyces venosus 120613-1 TaxID=1336337 RepID=A0A3N4JTA4_9PEZI|nr:hypothetical protein L873DRAFT_818134 [Choiromyces venosus 120613-1]